MGTVFSFNMKRVLTLQEARTVLPIIRKITEESKSKVNRIVPVIEALTDDSSTERKKTLEREVNSIVEQWQSKIQKLGGEPKGLWLVDFDCGVGYFCWKFPESELKYFHGYTEGFKSRVKIAEDFDAIYSKKATTVDPGLAHHSTSTATSEKKLETPAS